MSMIQVANTIREMAGRCPAARGLREGGFRTRCITPHEARFIPSVPPIPTGQLPKAARVDCVREHQRQIKPRQLAYASHRLSAPDKRAHAKRDSICVNSKTIGFIKVRLRGFECPRDASIRVCRTALELEPAQNATGTE